MRCKYCNSEMQWSDHDPMPGGYSTLYICNNKECGACYEEWWDSKDKKRTPEKDAWFKN